MSTDCIGLKKSNCKNCYKCIRHCPVKSIRFSGNQAHVMGEECVLCGQCVVVCPQNAKVVRSDRERVKVLLQSGDPVVVSLAPSFVASFPGATIASMEKALKQLGFFAAEETAIGAGLVKTQYEELLASGVPNVLISSCCHSVNLLIRKHYPEALASLARVVSPMVAHCKVLKEKYAKCHTVFIGPCIAKKDEADEYSQFVDCALTYEELVEWFKEANVSVEKGQDNTTASKARLFPTSGGILGSMHCDAPEYAYIAVDGMENCINAIEDIISGKLQKCFVEMSACSGSCIGGPVITKQKPALVSDSLAVRKYAGPNDFVNPNIDTEQLRCEHPFAKTPHETPSETEICAVLRKMGKVKPEDELNCGSCGYDSCRSKAVAVIRGKADLSMCLPFLKDKAESFSDNIINNTPNGIVVLNESLEVQQINESAMRMLNIRAAGDVLGEQVIRILDPQIFTEVMETGHSVLNRRSYFAEYMKYIDQSVIYDKSYRIIICIMRDVTDEQSSIDDKEQFRRHTIEVTDQVVEKQMRVVQEIASLLGETTAETKIALTKLKESLSDEPALH